MFVESLLGQLIKLRKPLLSDFDNLNTDQYLSLTDSKISSSAQGNIDFYEENRNNKNSIIWSVENVNTKECSGFVTIIKISDKFVLDIFINNDNLDGKEIFTEVLDLVLNYINFKKKIKKVYTYCKIENYILKNILTKSGFSLISSDSQKSLFCIVL